MTIQSHLNIGKAIPNFTVFIYWGSGWFSISSYFTYSRKWFMKQLSCYKSLGEYTRSDRPSFQEPKRRKLKRRIK